MLPGLQSSFSLIWGRETVGLLPSTLLPACRRLETACPERQVTAWVSYALIAEDYRLDSKPNYS